MYKSYGLKHESEVLDAVAIRLIKSGPSPPMNATAYLRNCLMFNFVTHTVYPQIQGGRQ